jgi:hypothetical protein
MPARDRAALEAELAERARAEDPTLAPESVRAAARTLDEGLRAWSHARAALGLDRTSTA